MIFQDVLFSFVSVVEVYVGLPSELSTPNAFINQFVQCDLKHLNKNDNIRRFIYRDNNMLVIKIIQT
jgi:hypothetical protein